jgi:hypothetical protein
MTAVPMTETTHFGAHRDQRDIARAEQRGDRALRATHGLVDLLTQRPDLRGVYLPADLFDDSVKWCA